MALTLFGALAPVVSVVDGKPTTTSVDVARKFGKRHDHVMRLIRNLIAQLPDGGVPNFGETPYTDSQNGQTYPAYRLTRDGFTLLAMGFTGKKALAFKLAYIDAFNRMEAELAKPRTPDTRSLHTTARHMAGFAAAVGLQVQMVVLDMMAQGRTTAEVDASLNGHRWIAHFDSTGRAHAREISQDAVVMSLTELAHTLAADGDLPATNAQLASLALACNQRLAKRLAGKSATATKFHKGAA